VSPQAPDPLDTYRAKRDLSRTPEPGGGKPSDGALRFVVQEHHATRLHWDFRLELDGVLLSWAVPKGPSLDPADKRLAVHVEDHPLDYAGFEGEIPAGEYGAGSVMIWDSGWWEPVGDARAGLAKGDFKFTLHGSRLNGRWVLVRMKPRPKERAENWLLIKERDAYVREGGEPPVELALCTLVKAAPTGPGWLSEVKYDGYRLTISLAGGSARCYSRNGHDVTDRFAPLARAVEALPATDAVLDGEAVVFDERGTTDFGALQKALSEAPERIAFAAFDLLSLNGHDTSGLSTLERKDLLATLLEEPAGAATRIVFAHHVIDDAQAFYDTACAQGLEGAVFKRADAPYPHGRTRTWLKAKCRLEGEFVVAGYTEPEGARSGFGALVLGVYSDDGALVHAGRVGSGFSHASLTRIAPSLAAIVRDETPFAEAPTSTDPRTVRWVEPVLVARVAFAEWTPEGVLRQASFLGLRDDVDPRSVRREEPAASGLAAADTTETAPAAPTATDSTVLGITISNPTKRLFPESEFSKLDLARYYEAIAPLMLTQVAGRPLTLVRCPVGDGRGTCFYQRHPDRGLSPHLRVLPHALVEHDEADEWLFAPGAEGLVALAQMGVAEIHTWLSHADAPSRPDRIVFDLDPGPGVEWPQMVRAAHAMREECASLGFVPHVKSTGSKGLHVVLAIEPVWEFTRIRALARGIAERVCAAHPDELTPKMTKNRRDGRIFVDYLRNAEGASAVAPYSTRHLSGPSVAVPLAWEELDDASLDIRSFTPTRVLERVRAGVDPWAGLADSAAGSRALRAAEGSFDI
jgi:bifunctional non-homologous end joining protein LigD